MIIHAHIIKASMKDPIDFQSITMWIKQFKNEDWVTLGILGEKQDMFLLSWISPWQKKVNRINKQKMHLFFFITWSPFLVITRSRELGN